MKRISLFLISFILVVTLFSCSKDSTPAPTTTSSATSWTINGTSYTSNSVERNTTGSGFQLVVYADNYIQVYFPTLPTASSTYKVVSSTKASTNTLASDEVAVGFGVGSTDSYYSTGTGNITATVTVGTGGKLKVVIPSFEVQHVNGSGVVGTTTASATINE